MLIIIIGQNPFWESSATSNRWLSLINSLNQHNTEVKLLFYGGYHSLEEKQKWGFEGSKDGLLYKYINKKIIRGYFKIRYYNYIGYDLEFSRILKLIVKEIRSSMNSKLVWTDSSLAGFKIAVQLKKHLPERKLFLEMSEFLDIQLINKGNYLQKQIAGKRLQFFDKKAFKAYDGIALMTKTLIKHYLQYPKPHPEFLHLPMTVDLERFNFAEPPLPNFEKPYIAYVGVMSNAKDGVDILIEAFHKISKQFPTYRLYLIGTWNYDTPDHLQMIKDYSLNDRVFWMKQYPREKIPAIIKNADLLALPRPDSKQAQGGFPTKLGEYLATGNPVCATRVGEIPDYLKDRESVYFAEPGSLGSFTNAMSLALSNPEEAKIIGMKGRRIAEKHFNKDIQGKKLSEFLLNLRNAK